VDLLYRPLFISDKWNLPRLILGLHLTVLAGKMNSAAMKGTLSYGYNCAETLFAALLAG
jgi:hypothetical protein